MVYNLDSASTKVCVVHDYTQKIKKFRTTLSLEILSCEHGLGNLAEASFSFRAYTFIRSLDIGKCYQTVRSVGKFVLISLNIWFQDIINQLGPQVIARETLSFGNPISGFCIEMAIYYYIEKELTDNRLKEIISGNRYSDNLNIGTLKDLNELNNICEQIVRAFSKYGLFFKEPIEPFCQMDKNDPRLLGKKKVQL